MTMIHSRQWSTTLWPFHTAWARCTQSSLLTNHCTAGESNWCGGKSHVWQCHLSLRRTPHLLQLPQKHWPTHGQCGTRWPMDWSRCICGQKTALRPFWMARPTTMLSEDTNLAAKLSDTSIGQSSSHGWLNMAMNLMWQLKSSPKGWVRCSRSTRNLTIEQNSELQSTSC